MCIFLATNKTRHLSVSHQLIFSCKISVRSFLIFNQIHVYCCTWRMPLLLLIPHSSDNAFCKCFLPACRSSLQSHTIRDLFFFSSQTCLLCPHFKSASKSVFASNKVTSMFFPCSLNQSLSQLRTRPAPRFMRCISVSNCVHYLSKELDGPLHQVTLIHTYVLLCVICVGLTCMSQCLC